MKTYTIKQGDTLSIIAGREYGDIHLWPIIASANAFITNPNVIQPGQVITIPEIQDVEAEIIESKTGNTSGTFQKLFPWLLALLAAAGIGYAVHRNRKKSKYNIFT